MYDTNNMPARTRMSHYLRTGQKINGFQPDSYKSYDLCDLCGGTVYDLDIKGIRSERNMRYRTLFQNYEKAKLAGKTHKIWQIRGGSTTRQSHKDANGQKVRIDEKFRVGGEELFLPNDPEASLSETANCRCSVRYVGGKNKPARSVAKITRTIRNNREKIVVVGGRYVTVIVQNFQIFFAPMRATLSSFPLDANGNRITVFQNNPEPFIGHFPPLAKRTYRFDAGPVGDSYKHVLIVSPDTRATGADFIVNVTLEARD